MSDPTTVVLNLNTFEVETNDSSSNSDVSDQATIIYDEFMDNDNVDNGMDNYSTYSDNSGDDFYEIDTVTMKSYLLILLRTCL